MDVYPRYSGRGDSYIAEVAFARGPLTLGTGADYHQLFDSKWMLLLDREANELSLWQESSGSWTKRTTITDAPTPLDKMRHISLAFDQQGRAIVAYENDASQIYIRQWDSTTDSFVYRGPFSGVDPVLINDALLHYNVGVSDILCYHLSADRKTLIARVQAEQYANENAQQTFSSSVYIDQVIDYTYKLGVYGSLVSSPNETGVVLFSDAYPRYVADDAFSPSYITGGGEYIPIVIILRVEDDAFAPSYSTGSANYISIVVTVNASEDAFSPSYIVGSGEYITPLTVIDLGSDNVATITYALGSASYDTVVVVENLTASQYSSPDSVASAQFLTGGVSYDNA